MSKNLTDVQFQAATESSTAISLNASAGSGKTSTLVERYVRLLRAGCPPRQILTITFTREAAQQLKDRILSHLEEVDASDKVRDEVIDTKTIGTIHSLCFYILNQYGSELGFEPIKSILDPSSFFSSFNRTYRDWLERLPPDRLKALLIHFNHRELREVAQRIYQERYLFFDCLKLACEARAKDRGAQVLCLLAESIKPMIDEMTERFQSAGSYSFDDLEYLSLRILRESALARARLSNEFTHILVDEFQDTSPTQWQIIQTLLGENPEKLFIVGDPKQSIYGFRQAEPALFDEVTQLITARGGLKLELLHNFRSEPQLLKEVNALSERLFEGQAFRWTPMISGFSSASQTQDNHFQRVYYGSTEKSTRRELQDQEPQALLAWIESRLTQGVSPNSIALLFRNADRINEFSSVFENQGVPVQCKKTNTLTHQLTAIDLVSFLQFLSNPLLDSALINFLRSQYMNWSFADILELTKKRKFCEGRWESLFYVLMRECPTPLQWLLDLVQSGEAQIDRCLDRLFINTRQFPENTAALSAVLSLFSRPGLSLFEIQDVLNSFSDSEVFFQEIPAPKLQGGVSLMTVHAAKGLEFDHVVLVDTLRQLPQESPSLLLKAGLPPGLRYWDGDEKVASGSYQSLLDERKEKDRAEARRILYVAMTRAKKSLTLFVPHPTAIAYPQNSWADLLMTTEPDSKVIFRERSEPVRPDLSL